MSVSKPTVHAVSTFVAFAVVIAGGVYWELTGKYATSPTDGAPPESAAVSTVKPTRTYVSGAYGIGFDYPEGYYLAAREAGTPERSQLSVVLVEDTQRNRDVVDGRATDASEGPPAVTVDAYRNPGGVPVRDWLRAETNWTLGDGNLIPTMVGEEPGYAFTWSGLYEGGSVVVGHGDRVYVISVTWLSDRDRIIDDYQNLLKSVWFTD